VDVEFVSNQYTVEGRKIIQCNIRNITDRKRAELTLNSSEIRYRRLFETAQDGILILDGETGTIFDANPFIIDLLGFTLEELTGKEIWEIGFIKDKDLAEKAASDLKINKYVRYEDLPLETKAGRSVDVEFVSNQYTVEGKKIIQCNIRSITDRKQAELKLNSSEIRYRRLFETAQDGILILDAETGTIIDANPYIIGMMGFTLEELTGKEIWEIGFIKDKDLAKKAASDLKINKYVRYEDFPLETKDGRSVEVEFVSNVYMVDDKKIIQCNIWDVTDRKHLENEISKALKEKEVLLKEIHHRVKNNIQVISSLLKIQSQQAKDPAVKEIFLEINTKVKGIALIHEMLYKSKRLSDIDYAAYLKNFTTLVFQSYNVNSLQIGLIIDTEKIMVGIDKAIPLSLIINELLINALKYAFPGSRTGNIVIRVRKNDDNMILTFSDDGIGLPLTVTFDKEDTVGMNLLSGLATQLGGTISVERISGTEYTLIFPLSDDGG
jgi:PAS domain S-box-containing protein